MTYNSGGGSLSQHFIWKVPENFSVKDALTTNQQVIDKLKSTLPVYHTRAMRREFINAYGCVTANTKPYIFRSIYKSLTGDTSSSDTTDEAAIDQRLKEAIESEDIDLIIDLREANEGRVGKYNTFWSKCNEYLQECSAVPDRRHGEVCFMAKAIST